MEKEKPRLDVVEAADNPQAEDQDFVVKFAKPYQFEGKAYTEVDLSGLEDLTAEDMIQAEKYLVRNGGISAAPELSITYTCFIAAVAADKPVEFFRGLPPKDALKVKSKVTSFFYGED